MSTLLEKYQTEVAPRLAESLRLANKMSVPKIIKVVINASIGDIKGSRDEQEKFTADLSTILGQKPSVRQARKSIAGFNLRQGDPVGISATLRGRRMYDFLEKLFVIVLPRIRDFRGVSKKGFDIKGNYTLGLTEHTVFPEIDLGKVNKVRGLQVTIVTNTKNKEESLQLLGDLGMPFEKE
jgi:large subunit ribosomal protein L5